MKKKDLTISFPGESKSRVNRAGSAFRNEVETDEDLRVIDEWRAAHGRVLNTFQASLRARTQGKNIVVAQRHKRRNTIYGKLKRFPKMQLARMDDVAGCRLIFTDIRELHEFRVHFHTARFRHKRRNDVDKYDYLKKPKTTGYRGIHDVYSYDVKSKVGEALAGLLIEIQYRTRIQHAWATAVEIVGFVTKSQPKFEQGDKRYEHAMALASEILARAFEGSTGPYPEKSDNQILKEFKILDKDLSLLRILKGVKTGGSDDTENRNTILIFSPDNNLEIQTFRDAPEAIRMLFKLEKERPKCDIVLVKADKSEDIRMAFKNYFSDTEDFISLIASGQKKLSS